MDTAQVWNTLGSIQIGTLIAWATVFVVVVMTVFHGIKRLYEFISKAKEMKDTNEKQSKILEEHEKQFREIRECLAKISKSLDEQKGINMRYTRHIIVDACNTALLAGSISVEQLASIEEMYTEYTTIFNGNSYASVLVEKVRGLPIVDVKDNVKIGEKRIEPEVSHRQE